MERDSAGVGSGTVTVDAAIIGCCCCHQVEWAHPGRLTSGAGSGRTGHQGQETQCRSCDAAQGRHGVQIKRSLKRGCGGDEFGTEGWWGRVLGGECASL